MSVAIVTQLVTQRGAAPSVSRQQDHRLILDAKLPALTASVRLDRLPGRARIAAAQAGAPSGEARAAHNSSLSPAEHHSHQRSCGWYSVAR
jgi:hypothetical protein